MLDISLPGHGYAPRRIDSGIVIEGKTREGVPPVVFYRIRDTSNVTLKFAMS
jgi:hypothetical protein